MEETIHIRPCKFQFLNEEIKTNWFLHSIFRCKFLFKDEQTDLGEKDFVYLNKAWIDWREGNDFTKSKNTYVKYLSKSSVLKFDTGVFLTHRLENNSLVRSS